MAPNRPPGFIGSDYPFAGQAGDEPDNPLREHVPGHIGDEVELDAGSPKPGGSSGGGASTTGELNIVAEFPNPWSSNPTKELQQLAAKKWWPGTVDFQGVAGSGAVVVADVWTFLLTIIKFAKPISRLNFFSHGMPGFLSCKGTIDPSGDSVSFDNDPDTKWTQIFGKPKAIVDPYAKTWGVEGENPDTILQINKQDVTLRAVRSKFAAGAVIWLYICNSAVDTLPLQQFANVFQATVKGFTKEVVYCVGTPAELKARKHKVTINTENDPEKSCQKQSESDFRKLDSHSTVRTVSPKTP